MSTTSVNGVTYVSTSGQIRWSDIKAAHGNSIISMSQMRGQKWYKSDFTRGNFPSAGNFSMSAFRGTSGSLPRVDRNAWPSVGKYFTSGNITLPPGFNQIKFIVYGAGGGGGGANGLDYQYNILTKQWQWVTTNGGAGGTGGKTSIFTNAGTYEATGGAGGNQASNGANGYPDPGSATDYLPGGAGNGAGGKGGRYASSVVNADTAWSTASSMFNQSCSTIYGAGGAAGPGGGGTNPGSSGAPGSAGGISVFVDAGLY